MSGDKEFTKVIFRFWKGEVIAIFPELYGNSRYDCESYMHFGQHGACDPHHIIDHSRLAKFSEFSDLATELRQIGYRLEVRKRITPQMRAQREANWTHDIALWQQEVKWGTP